MVFGFSWNTWSRNFPASFMQLWSVLFSTPNCFQSTALMSMWGSYVILSWPSFFSSLAGSRFSISLLGLLSWSSSLIL